MLERACVIIKKLQQMVDDNANTEVLLTISQMLVAELEQIQGTNAPQSVSVTMPRRTLIATEVAEEEELPGRPVVLAEEKKGYVIYEPAAPIMEHQPVATEDITSKTAPEEEAVEQPQPTTWFVEAQKVPETTVYKEEFVLEMSEEGIPETMQEVVMPMEYEHPLAATPNDYLFDEPTQVPTLPDVELASFYANETNQAAENEVNNRFRENKVEVAHLLENSHIKDLRRGISINDKYLFINELFAGDESLYDKSIRQIQGFSIFAEATFWIQRELKIKLNWSADNEVVQLFDQLVKRRFS